MLLLALTLAPIIVDHLVRILRHVRAEFKAVAATIPWREWGQTSLGLTLVLAISSSDLYLYTIFVGHLVGSTEAGAFFASLKSVELLNMFLMSVTLVVAPEISRAVARNDRDGLQLVCNRAIILQGIPCLLATVLVIAAAAGFMWIFDPSFVRYANLLRLLAVGMLLNALSGATVLMLQLIGKHWLQVFLQGGSLLIALLLLPTMVQFLGIYGTAISFILSKLLWNVAAVVTIRRSRGVDPSIFGLLDRQTGGLKGALAAVAGKANTQHG
jgi:O-antigen/teichoic acid export membrane protein